LKPPEDLATVSLRAMIRSQAQQNPSAEALFASECRPFTYGQLSDQVGYVGHALRSRGIECSDRVAVVLPNGPFMASAFLGIASYAVCAPLNPDYRRDEFEFYLTDLAVKAILLLADSDLPARDVARRLGLTVLDLEPSTPPSAGGFKLLGVPPDSESPGDWGRSADVALVLHTSGTTARPKQVPLSHRNLGSSARNIVRTLALTRADRCLNVMPLFHIHGLNGVLLSSICAGGSVVCSSGYESDSFARLMHDFQPTWYSAVPTIHQSVLALAKENPAIAAGGHLRLIRSSSSALPPTVMAELERTFGVPVIESYGMTEAAHQMASNPLPPGVRKPGSVGLPAGPEMAIMGDGRQMLPAGAIGEIVIRGANVTEGYADNPKANEAAFTDGWFRTGDRGRMDDDGYFYITGRTKEMINRGGEKISPREIDEVLLEHPAVTQAIAFAVPHASLGEDVAAAIVLRKGANVSEQGLRAFAFSRLAAFKVPSQIVFVDAIPKGPTGKLQRIGLHEKLLNSLRGEYVPPRTEMEGILLGLWQEVLTAKDLGVRDNFFGCGGDSLTASRLVARINSRFDLDLAVTGVFRAPSIEAQAVLVESALLDQMDSE
jgi:acyl-CoA synthetase (AMP-forming)/AMP-acid ligase II